VKAVAQAFMPGVVFPARNQIFFRFPVQMPVKRVSRARSLSSTMR
jgi:hypothetical protein